LSLKKSAFGGFASIHYPTCKWKAANNRLRTFTWCFGRQ